MIENVCLIIFIRIELSKQTTRENQMEKLTFKLVVTIILTFLFVNGYAQPVNEGKEKSSIVEANVWTGEDGNKYYKCPVMGGEGVVDSTTTFSIVDGKRYYYCCAGCAEKFQANPS